VYRAVGSFAVAIGAGTLERAMTAAAQSPRASAEPPAYPVLRHRSAPPAANPPLGDVADLRAFVESHPRLFVLTGAGCSTDSGIPDYRDATGAWKRASPVEYVPFMRDPLTRSRYWARSLIGWRSFGAAAPNAAHHALAALERSGHVRLLVTQNVDGLHQAAGSRRVVDLHGRLDAVVCTTCRRVTGRDEWQHELAVLNSSWVELVAPVAPDGDADLDKADFAGFRVPDCRDCGGVIKPDVVFFGESVPRDRHVRAAQALPSCDAVLVAGSSLMVQSGYRHALAAFRQGLPVVAVNLGRTRADPLLALKVEAPVGSALAVLARDLAA
jgi:NAD-dependent SIR2 family protein deacetylase